MEKILVIGASGFVGRHLARKLLGDGYPTRCLARTPAKVAELPSAGCEIVRGNMADQASLEKALASGRAVYRSIHLLSPQPGSHPDQGCMDVELRGLQNIVSACQAQGVRRLIYVTFLGVAPDAPNAWVRGRWRAEQFLLNCGLDVTVIRPGRIVGVGSHGFAMTASQARRSIAPVLGSGQQKMASIAVADLIDYLVGVLDDPQASGQYDDVGHDDILTINQMIDQAAEIQGRPHPRKIHIPRSLLVPLTSIFERLTKLPRGALKGLLDCTKMDTTGDPRPIRVILP